MNWDETQEILLYLTRLNPAMKVVAGMTDAWYEQLSGFSAAEVQAAARLVGGEQTWVGVADLRAACKRARAERLRVARPIEQLIKADPEDMAAWHAERAALTADIASGRRDANGHLVSTDPPRLEAL